MTILQKIKFLTSAATIAQLPADLGREVAFMGRSNSGKSSSINAITNIRQLAHASKTPGRTQLLNFFSVDNDDKRLVDLPGYGYAKTDRKTKASWQQTLSKYLANRRSLQGIILIIDIRRGLMAGDMEVINWCANVKLPAHLLLNKSDKLSRSQTSKALLSVKAALGKEPLITVQLFSAMKKSGVDSAVAQICSWLRYRTNC